MTLPGREGKVPQPGHSLDQGREVYKKMVKGVLEEVRVCKDRESKGGEPRVDHTAGCRKGSCERSPLSCG